MRIRLILLSLLLSACSQSHYVQFGGYAQGGVWSVKANIKGVKARPAEIQKGIEAILEEIDTTLSGYNKRSQLSRYNAGEPVQLSPMFLEVKQAADKFKEETGGALNCAAGPLYDIWGFGFKTDSLPSDELVRQTLADCGITVCSEKQPKTGTNQQPKLNFNAIAQGYSCDKVAAYLYSLGIKDMLVDIGEIFCDGLNPSGKPWRVGIDKPEDGNNSPGAKMEGIWESNGGPQGVVTSGNYRKFYIKDGVKYSHTIDPRTGYPVQHKLLSATVIAPTAIEADAYATYCMVIGTEKAQEFILSRPDLEACLISEEIWTSPGFKLQ
ncbi:MAG: FAD:protein FMN transferase [Bacteroidales bacterium]|nr:FAD:protein FMN transferase [Bacteroidales bacterium]